MVVAYLWASRVLTVSLEMVLPGVGGLWLDGKLETTPLFTVVGFSGGLALGMWHLLTVTRASATERKQKR
ncbi:AtpZ/AtpI family protein [Aeoliella mucimassa]|uniref:F0F1-ATPase subunit (ATPase_gene1) n=1 Tax=Aeoliella mucimassa TaxID=2527972 RepID=A0A518ANS8_9BACT|nr:Putative F0F1-ATPase subunit (ATPase_gene1) [Aeoliella mucimassa]